MNRQQIDDPERGRLYEALKPQFRMPEADVERLEQKLRMRAAALVQAEDARQAQQDDLSADAVRQDKTDEIYSFMRRFRLIPLTACVALCIGVMWSVKTKFPGNEVSTVSEIITEMTAPATTSDSTNTTTQSTHTSLTASTANEQSESTAQTTILTTLSLTEAEITTAEPPVTESPDSSSVPETTSQTTKTTTTTESAETTTGTSAAEPETTTTVSTTTNAAEREQLPPIRLLADSRTVRAGEDAEILLTLDCADQEMAGMQIYLYLPKPAQINSVEEWWPDSISRVSDDNHFVFVGAGSKSFKPGKKDLTILTIHIPEDAAAGTVYSLMLDPSETSSYSTINCKEGKILMDPVTFTVTD